MNELRAQVWAKLDDLVRTHRTFAYTDANWVLPPAELDRLERIADQLRPRDPSQAHEWLFAEQLPEVGTDPHDHEQRQADVAQLRREAVRAILLAGAADAVVRFAERVRYPGLVGDAAAQLDDPRLDDLALSFLDDADGSRAWFATAYMWSKTTRRGWQWAQTQIEHLRRRPVAQARVLQGIDDLEIAWRILGERDAETVAAYWKEFRYVGHGADFALAGPTAEKLLEFDRPLAALDLLAMYARRDGPSISPYLVARALETLVTLPPDHPEPQRVSAYEIGELLEFLRATSFDETRLAQLEWQLLPAREFDARSPVLERYIARSPAFFVELISLVYKPRGRDEPKRAAPHVIANAYRLLHDWRVVPGTRQDGSIDPAALTGWIEDARGRLRAAERLEVGDLHIGRVLAHAAADADGSWPTVAVRNAIQRVASGDLEDGFGTEIVNQRGVTSRGLLDGGAQERTLAASWRSKADLVRDGWPRVAAVLDRAARSYEQEAQMFDAEAERRRQGLDD